MRTLFLGFLILSSSVLAQAQGTRLWKQSSFESFEKGEPAGVAIRSDGRLETSPAAVEVLTTPAAYVWSVAVDARGNAYLGTGSPAMVLKVAPDGRSTKLLETKDVSVQVVRMGPDGMLYAATLPNGNVYRIDPNGPEVKLNNAPQPVYKQSAKQATSRNASPAVPIVFDPAQLSPRPTYIWDLAFDAAGRLYVATGGPAAIYRVDLKNTGAAPEKFFSSTEQHIRALLFARDGTLYAGSDGRGLVYRIAPDGKGFVLFEAPKQEISALALDPQGNLYAAALGDRNRSNLPPLAVHNQPTVVATLVLVTPGSIASSKDSTLVPDGTAIFQIAPDGTPRQLWASRHDVVYALAWQGKTSDSSGGLLVGSGNQGHLYKIDADGNYADLAHLESNQATAFATSGDNLYVGTSNTGKLYKLSANAAGKGSTSTYISPVKDAEFVSQWGRAQVRGSGKYDLFARVGNIEQPTEGWSDWQKVTPGDGPASLQKARFLQWKAVMRPGAGLSEVGFFFLPQNIAPVVDGLVVQLHARVTNGSNPEGQITPVPISFPPNTTDGVSYQVEQAAQPLMALPTRAWATARWKAHDDNGDRLSYSLYYRGDGEASWQLLQKDLHRDYTSFELTRIPDGGYKLRVVASDAPSHPAGDALTGFKDSGHFLLDTTPPVLSPIQAAPQNGAIHVVFDAKDSLSTVARAYCSVDAGPWQYVEPMGKLSDSAQEHYDFTATLPKVAADGAAAPAATQHVVAVRVVDRAGNAATAKAVVQ
ncbi:MAG: fibronectin type III domain-containing protein [Acidobacteriaceae bacterium]